MAMRTGRQSKPFLENREVDPKLTIVPVPSIVRTGELKTKPYGSCQPALCNRAEAIVACLRLAFIEFTSILSRDARERPANCFRVKGPSGYFPMQKVEKIRLRISSEVVWPVSESSAQ